MKRSNKIFLLGFLTVIAVFAVFLHTPIAQDPSYHDLADKRILIGVPNFLNVFTNLPFVLIGLVGIAELRKAIASRIILIIYFTLFTGIFLTGWGSAYYHYSPSNSALVYDRIPMTLVFMALLSAIIAEHFSEKTASYLLYPLLLIGIGSVLYWRYAEQIGAGDLRLYGLVQFYPMVLIPLILLLFPAPAFNRGLWQLMGVIAWYVIAKICEHFDKEIYAITKFVSGHSLKHLAAAAATWYLVRMFQKNYRTKPLSPMQQFSTAKKR